MTNHILPICEREIAPRDQTQSVFNHLLDIGFMIAIERLQLRLVERLHIPEQEAKR